jgi:hypothetical protein
LRTLSTLAGVSLTAGAASDFLSFFPASLLFCGTSKIVSSAGDATALDFFDVFFFSVIFTSSFKSLATRFPLSL